MSRKPMDDMSRLVAGDVEALCAMGDNRHPGSEGNRQATEYVASSLAAMGYDIERIGFECLDWRPGTVALETSASTFEAFCGPYSPPFEGELALVDASSPEGLSEANAAGKLLLLHGELTKDQLTPRNYPFYQMEGHVRLIEQLERLAPAAIIAATGRNPQVVGGLYPFPFIEDGDFDIPSAYMKDVEGTRLLQHSSEQVRLKIDSERLSASGEQVVATKKGAQSDRVVLTAHVDARKGTPGALDNAAGVACLLAAGRLLAERDLALALELVPFNGEDNYAAPGEVAYIGSREGDFSAVRLAVNVDAAGFRGDPSALSFYGCPPDLEEAARNLLPRFPEVVEGPQWPQSDHMIFAMRQVPSMAVTSSDYRFISSEITHTEKDVPELIDAVLLARTAEFLAELIAALRVG